MAIKNPTQGIIAIAAAICLLLFPAFITLIVGYPLIDKFLALSGHTQGGYGNVLAAVVMIPIFAGFLTSFFISRPAIIAGLLLVMLPIWGRSRDMLYIPIYQQHEWTERLGLTSLLIIIVFLVFLIRKIPMRLPDNKLFLRVEISLWLFAILGTLGQLVNHDPGVAILLAFNGLWQYLLWFYIITGATCNLKDIRLLLCSLSFMVMVNMPLRYFFSGELYSIDWVAGGFENVVRFGAGGLGWANNYAIVAVIIIILNGLLYASSQSSKEKIMWTFLSFLLVIDIIFTFTRLAMIMLILSLFLFILWRPTRRFATIVGSMILTGILFCIIIWPEQLSDVLLARAMFFSAEYARIELILMSLRDIFHNGGFGFGILKEREYTTSFFDLPVPVHNFSLFLIQSVGLWAAIAWFYFLFAPLAALLKNIMWRKLSSSEIPGVFLLIAVTCWIAYGMSGQHINAYHPFEANQVIYTLVALIVCWLSLKKNKGNNRLDYFDVSS